jgi:hypothetical protein
MDSKLSSNFAKTVLKMFTPLSILLLIASCAVDMNTVSSNVRGCPIRADSQTTGLRAIAEENRKALAWYKENEWQYNLGKKNQPPQDCLCFSGGGIRSAAFSIGVLKGLHEKKILDKIDIISGVSGGTYALSWYYFQQAGEDQKIKEIFFDNKWEEMFKGGCNMYTVPEIFLSTAGHIILLPVNILFNRLLSFNVNTSHFRKSYEQAIRKAFHSKKDMSFPEIAPLIKTNNLPYFIINTSAVVDYSSDYHGSKLSNRVFEFTPLRFGSDGYGYSDRFPITMGKAVSISGAAVDLSHTVPGRIESILLSILNIDLGYYIENYNNNGKHDDLMRLIPFYFLINQNDLNGTDIYLTDGGHSENLGMYSLVKRLCKRIIVVDATYDPNYQFTNYFKIKNALRSEMQVELEIKEIDKLQPKLGWANAETKSNVLIQKNPCNIYDPYDAKNCFDTSKPVVKGSISYFPIKDIDGTVTQRNIDITYIKLSIDEKMFKDFPTDKPEADVYREAREYYGKELVKYYLKSKKKHSEFPQYTTLDQTYSRDQFKTFVDLGYHIVRNELNVQLRKDL